MRVWLLKKIYFACLWLLFILIVLTPVLIKDGFSFFSEEIIEVFLLIFLWALSWFVFWLYRREINKGQDKLTDALNYLGALNAQVESLRSVFSDIEKYPENKSDWRYIIRIFSERISGIAKADWVLLRVINTINRKTLTEHFYHDPGSKVTSGPKVSNSNLLNEKKSKKYLTIKSLQKNLDLRVFCILPKVPLNEQQKIILEKIVSDLGMFYLIFKSVYYKNSRAIDS